MARTTSFDGDFEDMPSSVLRALAVDRDFYKDARCRTNTGRPSIIWTREPKGRTKIGDQWHPNHVLISWALLECSMCPVQWDCAATAIAAGEAAGVWGDTLKNLQSLGPEDEAINILEMARSSGVTVQKAVQINRSGLT